jgi:hypothetical protein
VPFAEPRSEKIYNVTQKSFETALRLYPPEWSYFG